MFSSFSRSPSASRVFSSSSAPLEEILNREDLQDILCHADGQGQRLVLSYIERNLPRILAAAQRDQPKHQLIQSTNAAALIVRFVQTHPNQSEAIRRVVPSTVGTLARKGCLPASASMCFQRVLLAAFDEDFSHTSYGVNIALGDEIVHGAIRNLSSNAVIGETLIALFGSALSATTMMLPSTTPNIFTDVWIKHGFPFHVSAYCRIAMTNLEFQPYFTFMQELVKRGLSHSAGPIVDALLQSSTFGDVFVVSVLESCEATSTVEAYPLASEGLSVIASSIALIRRTLPPTETFDQYNASIESCGPLKAVLSHVSSICGLLAHPAPPQSGEVRRVGLMRLSALEILLELVQCNLRAVDKTLIAANAIPVVFALWEAFPNNDFVGRAVERVLVSIFGRRKPTDLPQQEIDDILLDSIYISDTSLLDRLATFSTSSAFAGSSLQATSLNIAVQLNETQWFSSSAAPRDGFFATLLQLECAQRVHQWMSPITGTAFADPGSGCPGFVPVHRPSINPMNVHVVQQTGLLDEVTFDDDVAPLHSIDAVGDGVGDRGSRYLSSTVEHDDDQADADESSFRFVDTSDDADTVNIDDTDPIETPKTDSCDRFDDEAWVEQTILDVSSAVD